MDIFFESQLPPNGNFTLNADESFHCIKVMRKKVGQSVEVMNGNGRRAHCIISSESPKSCLLEIQSIEEQNSNPYQLHIAVAPTKNIERLEYFLEKATEIGILSITPILCKNSERRQIKHERLEKIILAACKQSKQFFLPVLHELTSFSDLIKNAVEPQKLIAVCEDDTAFFPSVYRPHIQTLIVIGPEGDFSKEEVQLAKNGNFIPMSLGPNRLRVETAALVACSWANLQDRTSSNK